MTVTGGEKLLAALGTIADRTGAAHVRVGFLEGAKYSDGLPVATVAYWNEFGGTFTVPAHDVTIYRHIDKEGNFNGGTIDEEGNRIGASQFRKKATANFETTHHVDAYTVTRPARPFFRQMIAKEAPECSGYLEAALLATDLDGEKALKMVGEKLENALKDSINEFTTPKLAASAIRAKGFDKPLIHSGHMLNSTGIEYVPGNTE